MDRQDNLELYIRMRSHELYQEWSNNPSSTVVEIIAQGMMDAIRHQRQPGVLIIEGQSAKDLMGLASAFVMEEEDLLEHLITLGKLAASTTIYLKNKSGAFVALEEVE